MRRIGIFSFLLCFVFLPVSAQEENEQLHVRVKDSSTRIMPSVPQALTIGWHRAVV